MSKINAKKIQSKLPWYEKWQKAITINEKEKQDKAKLQLFQKEVATLDKNLTKQVRKNVSKRSDIFYGVSSEISNLCDNNIAPKLRQWKINNAISCCEELDEKFYQSFERIGMVDWQKNALTDLKEHLEKMQKKA